MIFHQLFEHESSTYTYLLADETTLEGILIDPVRETMERDLKLIDELGIRLLYILDTHVHADHITASGHIRQKTGAKIVLSHASGVELADILLKDEEELSFGKHKIRGLMTPGHTNSCMSYACEDMVFTGDALLIRGCGRTDFQQGDSHRLYQSVHSKIFTLPEGTRIYPAHDYKGHTSSTVGQEKKLNPRLTLSEDGFVQFMANLNLAQPKKIRESVPANLVCGLEGEK